MGLNLKPWVQGYPPAAWRLPRKRRRWVTRCLSGFRGPPYLSFGTSCPNNRIHLSRTSLDSKPTDVPVLRKQADRQLAPAGYRYCRPARRRGMNARAKTYSTGRSTHPFAGIVCDEVGLNRYRAMVRDCAVPPGAAARAGRTIGSPVYIGADR